MTFDWTLVEAMRAERQALRAEARAAVAEARRMRMRLRQAIVTIRSAGVARAGGGERTFVDRVVGPTAVVPRIRFPDLRRRSDACMAAVGLETFTSDRCIARNSIAPAHPWITSSARTSIDCGTAMPSAFAVLRLITISNRVGCSTGNSPGAAPLRIRPA